jgi:putative N6-adenine-specific DNA methylase
LSLISKTFSLSARTFNGLESVLARELEQLGAQNVQAKKHSVSFSADTELMYKANLWLRTATKILKPISRFKFSNDQGLYHKIQEINWSSYLSVRDTYVIDCTLIESTIQHPRIAVSKVKEGINSYFKKAKNTIPTIELSNPDFRIHVHIYKESCTISLDTSGQPLNHRGYKQDQQQRYLNEAFAAGLILLSGWKKDCYLIDPMCNIGTIPIEASLIANNIAPNISRDHFAFMEWKDFDKSVWNKVVEDAHAAIRPFSKRIYGYDEQPSLIKAGKSIILNSKLFSKIQLEVARFEEVNPIQDKGMVIICPPPSDKIQRMSPRDYYEKLGNMLKSKYAGYTAVIYSQDLDALNFIGLKSIFKRSLYYGQFEGRMQKFEVLASSKKEYDY